MSDDIAMMTVNKLPHTTALNRKAHTLHNVLQQGKPFEIDFSYFEAIDEKIEKMDEHLYAYSASVIEKSIMSAISRGKVKECEDCVTVFRENIKVENDFINRKNTTASFHIPCQCTVNIIKATSKILDLLADKRIFSDPSNYNNALRTIMNNIDMDEFYSRSLFDLHEKATNIHKEEFIFKIINEYLKMKSRKIGTKISEEERGTYIRHSYRKRVHEKGQ